MNPVQPIPFAIVFGLMLVFVGLGLFLLVGAIQKAIQGRPARLRILDLVITRGAEGNHYSAIYEILNGPRQGEIVYEGATADKADAELISNTDLKYPWDEKQRAKIGRELNGWVLKNKKIGFPLSKVFINFLTAGFVLLCGAFFVNILYGTLFS